MPSMNSKIMNRKIGDEVWIIVQYEEWTGGKRVQLGRIININYKGLPKYIRVVYTVFSEGFRGTKSPEDVFDTKEQATQKLIEEYQNDIEYYRDKIKELQE